MGDVIVLLSKFEGELDNLGVAFSDLFLKLLDVYFAYAERNIHAFQPMLKTICIYIYIGYPESHSTGA